MHITKLKLLGFKSFVEPTELLIRPGLTGVVGPNGCGKSNLLEALRWVMGESSYKAMRGGAMDDVIFSGTQLRPARNNAEVTIEIDNKSRTAPAEFNDEETLQIVRQIQRGEGSRYRINGRDARAKDIKLLFEDAATGARSHALVRQGQIGEIVNAKPQARRRILEDAAGIAGLHSRRHEAELRLNASEDNLERLSDLIGQMDAQLNSLKRQARQAERYKELSDQLRQLEALAFYLKWQAQGATVSKSETALEDILLKVAEETRREAAALSKREKLISALTPLRLAESKAAATLERLTQEQESLQREEHQALSRKEELQIQLVEAESDKKRDESLIDEAKDITQGLNLKINDLETRQKTLNDALKESAKNRDISKTHLSEAERDLDDLQRSVSTDVARQQSLKRDIERQQVRAKDLLQRQHTLSEKLDRLKTEAPEIDDKPLWEDISNQESLLSKLQQEASDLEQKLKDAQNGTDQYRRQEHETGLKLKSLETEIGIIETLLAETGDLDAPKVIEEIETTPGYEKALWVALGDNLDVPLERLMSSNAQLPSETSPRTTFWRKLEQPSVAVFPPHVKPLLDFVKAPIELTATLQFIGIVDEAKADQLQKDLQPGQKLVSLSGGLWRWDGFVILPHETASLPRRLIERNRLPDLLQKREALLLAQGEIAADQLHAETKVSQIKTLIETNRATITTTQSRLGELTKQQREQGESLNTYRQTELSLTEGIAHTKTEHQNALAMILELEGELSALHHLSTDKKKLQELQATVGDLRTTYTEAQLHFGNLEQESEQIRQRLDEMATDIERWHARSKEAQSHVADLTSRLAKLTSDLADLKNLPQHFLEKRQKLLDVITEAEKSRAEAGDTLAEAETVANAHDKELRALQSNLMECREEKARIETQLENARSGLIALAEQIQSEFQVQPEACLSIAGKGEVEILPSLGVVEADISRFKRDRDRLGAVNLRAAEEIKSLDEQFGAMIAERDDLSAAVRQLRQAVQQLNEEGRQRLLAAFDVVNGHFKRLFQTLFSGGEAELKLVDSDDPLEAGLEIVARPPGKRPQVLTLLSGGEKALTAMSLIFAVFLTNPSPICVLDEVDAPLDDTNVGRFCRMMEDMAANTDTRFLVITHHPMTMERMDRLFGVTMSEKGVSQLVSVDLATAEALRESA